MLSKEYHFIFKNSRVTMFILFFQEIVFIKAKYLRLTIRGYFGGHILIRKTS